MSAPGGAGVESSASRKERVRAKRTAVRTVQIAGIVTVNTSEESELTTEVVVPVIAESIVLEKLTQDVETVRITMHVETERVVVDAPRIVESLAIERRAIDRRVEGPIEVRLEGDTTIISVVEEVVFVEKRFVLKEEIRVTKHRVQENLQAEVTLRREVARVEQTEGVELSTTDDSGDT